MFVLFCFQFANISLFIVSCELLTDSNRPPSGSSDPSTVDPIPRIPQVRHLVEDEASSDDFGSHLASEQGDEENFGLPVQLVPEGIF